MLEKSLSGASKTFDSATEIAIACEASLERQAKSCGTVLRLGRQRRVVGLCLEDQLFIVSEVGVAKLRVPVKPERFPDESIELAGQEIGQVECGELIAGALDKALCSFEECVAMWTAKHLDTQLGGCGLQVSTSAAIRVGEEYALVSISSGRRDGLANGGGDALGMIVQDRGQALQVDVLEAICVGDGKDLMRQRTTGKHKNAPGSARLKAVSRQSVVRRQCIGHAVSFVPDAAGRCQLSRQTPLLSLPPSGCACGQ